MRERPESVDTGYTWLDTVLNSLQRDPLGGMGILLGSGAAKFGSRLHPAMLRRLEQSSQPTTVTYGATLANPRGAAATTSIPRKSHTIEIAREHPTVEAHEGIHTLYAQKGQGHYPPPKYLPMLTDRAQRAAGTPGSLISRQPTTMEQVIEWMAENVLRGARGRMGVQP